MMKTLEIVNMCLVFGMFGCAHASQTIPEDQLHNGAVEAYPDVYCCPASDYNGITDLRGPSNPNHHDCDCDDVEGNSVR